MPTENSLMVKTKKTYIQKEKYAVIISLHTIGEWNFKNPSVIILFTMSIPNTKLKRKKKKTLYRELCIITCILYEIGTGPNSPGISSWDVASLTLRPEKRLFPETAHTSKYFT